MAGQKTPAPPRAYLEFTKRFPKLAQAWELLGEGGNDGPLDEKTCRLVKLGISIASRSEGATHSAARKALASGATEAEIYQVVALTASSIGLPAAVAAYTWVRDELSPPRKKR